MERACSAGIDRTFSPCIPPLYKHSFAPFPPRKRNRLNGTTTNLHALPQHTDPGRCALSTCTHIRDFQNSISVPTRVTQPVMAAVHGVTFRLVLDKLCAVGMRWASSDVSFTITEVDVGCASRGNFEPGASSNWSEYGKSTHQASSFKCGAAHLGGL